jgi:hypothetical protein
MSATVLNTNDTNSATAGPAPARAVVAPADSLTPTRTRCSTSRSKRFVSSTLTPRRPALAPPGLPTACGVLLALTAGLGSAAAQAAQRLSHLGAAVTVSSAAVTAVLLLAAAAISGQVFAPSRKNRMALEELREFVELRLRAADKELSSAGALERLAAARAANLVSRSRSICALALCVGTLGVLGAQVLLIALVHLLGI